MEKSNGKAFNKVKIILFNLKLNEMMAVGCKGCKGQLGKCNAFVYLCY